MDSIICEVVKKLHNMQLPVNLPDVQRQLDLYNVVESDDLNTIDRQSRRIVEITGQTMYSGRFRDELTGIIVTNIIRSIFPQYLKRWRTRELARIKASLDCIGDFETDEIVNIRVAASDDTYIVIQNGPISIYEHVTPRQAEFIISEFTNYGKLVLYSVYVFVVRLCSVPMDGAFGTIDALNAVNILLSAFQNFRHLKEPVYFYRTIQYHVNEIIELIK